LKDEVKNFDDERESGMQSKEKQDILQVELASTKQHLKLLEVKFLEERGNISNNLEAKD